MKPIKLENRITYFMITFAIFLLNFKFLSFLSLILGTILAFFSILLVEHYHLYQYKIIKVTLLFFSIPIMIYFLNKISYFIGDNILKEYSIVAISITLLITIFVLSNKGYHTIIKVILLSTYFLFFFLILGFVLTLPYININNLDTTILNTNSLFINTILYSLSLIYCYFLIYPTTKTKFLIKDFFISSLFHIIIYILTLSILGILINYLKYPYIIIFKKVNLLNFIERIEIIFSLNYLFFFYFLLLLTYYQIRTLLNLIIKKKKPLNIFLLFLSFFLFLISIMF